MSDTKSEGARLTPAKRIANQKVTIERITGQLEEREGQIERLKKQLKERDEQIAKLVKDAGKQREVHREVIESLLDRYDVNVSQSHTHTIALTFNGTEMGVADWCKE